MSQGAGALVSFGITGGLDPDLAPGELVLPERIAAVGEDDIATDPDLRARWESAATAAGLRTVGGGLLGIIGGLGVMRMPDFYTRLHAASITDTLCTTSILIGLCLLAGWSLALGKLLLILAFLVLAGPTAAHAMAKAGIHGGLRPATAAEDASSKT